MDAALVDEVLACMPESLDAEFQRITGYAMNEFTSCSLERAGTGIYARRSQIKEKIKQN